MSLYVVDSSVAIKWYVPEIHDAEARRLRSLGTALHAPDFLEVEIAAILWKKIRKGVLKRQDADDILTDLSQFTVLNRHPTTSLITSAFDLADQTGRTVYDCLYLALAMQLGGVMVTADDKLANALAGTPWASNIMKVQDVP